MGTKEGKPEKKNKKRKMQMLEEEKVRWGGFGSKSKSSGLAISTRQSF